MQISFTARVNEAFTKDRTAKAIDCSIRNFINLDFGEMPPEDVEANLNDLKDRAGRMIGRYKTPDGDIYLIYEFMDVEENDRLTVMFCDEY